MLEFVIRQGTLQYYRLVPLYLVIGLYLTVERSKQESF